MAVPLIDAAWEIQGGRCGICGDKLPSKEKAHADHDHETVSPFPRALLCNKCNTYEGWLLKRGYPPHLMAPAYVHYLSFYKDLAALAKKDPDGRFLPITPANWAFPARVPS